MKKLCFFDDCSLKVNIIAAKGVSFLCPFDSKNSILF